MGGNKKYYEGKNIKFIKQDMIGKGGNGKVFKTKVLSKGYDETYVVKILALKKWKGEIRTERYKRFKREIDVTIGLQDELVGIMKILDYYCPSRIPGNKEVWYIMNEAEGFHSHCKKINPDLSKKMQYILRLGTIIAELHKRGYSHRDIKTDNLLFLNDNLMLSDFGLIFNIEDKRITREGERVGPFYIGPPELENENLNISDYRPSDIYLFAKVIWEIIKEDYIGFRGQYKRNNGQFYLDPKSYGVFTFEPIHQLLEGATEVDMDKRIDIDKCLELIKEQVYVINKSNSICKIDSIVASYRFAEVENEICSRNEPEEYIYRNFEKMFNILTKLVSICDVYIEQANEIINVDSIKMINSRIFQLKGKSQSYLCVPSSVKYSKGEDYYDLEIEESSLINNFDGFVSYRESRNSIWNSMDKNVFFNEQLVLRFKKKIG